MENTNDYVINNLSLDFKYQKPATSKNLVNNLSEQQIYVLQDSREIENQQKGLPQRLIDKEITICEINEEVYSKIIHEISIRSQRFAMQQDSDYIRMMVNGEDHSPVYESN